MALYMERNVREMILDSRLLTQLFLPHKLPRPTKVQLVIYRPAALLRIIVNAIMAVVFGVCAAFQWNDPDPALWIPVYIFPSLACLTDVLSGYSCGLIMGSILGLAHVAYCVSVTVMTIAFYAMTHGHMDTDHFYEYMREFCGLFLVLLWHGHIFLAFHHDLSVRRKLQTGTAYIFGNIFFVTASWIAFPHMDDSAHSMRGSNVLLENSTTASTVVYCT